MPNRLAQKRRRRLSLEGCEPCAMLSAAPVPTPQTELAARMPALYSLQAGPQSNLFSITSISTEVTTGFSNLYGAVLGNSGTIVPLFHDGIPRHVPWNVIRVPLLDPISFPIGLPAPQTPGG